MENSVLIFNFFVDQKFHGAGLLRSRFLCSTLRNPEVGCRVQESDSDIGRPRITLGLIGSVTEANIILNIEMKEGKQAMNYLGVVEKVSWQ